MVNTNASAENTSAAKPATPKRLALEENWVRYPSTWREMLSGIKLSTNQRCIPAWNCPKMGNIVKAAKTTVNKGTKAMEVVKVKLPAV